MCGGLTAARSTVLVSLLLKLEHHTTMASYYTSPSASSLPSSDMATGPNELLRLCDELERLLGQIGTASTQAAPYGRQ